MEDEREGGRVGEGEGDGGVVEELLQTALATQDQFPLLSISEAKTDPHKSREPIHLFSAPGFSVDCGCTEY